MFWNTIKQYYVNSINYSYQNCHLTKLQGIITLIPKRKKETTLLENWRPISLLNTDYKIATKVIGINKFCRASSMILKQALLKGGIWEKILDFFSTSSITRKNKMNLV